MRSRGSWQPVEPASCAIPCSVVEKPGDSRNDCRLLYLRACENTGRNGVGMLAGGMQIFDASVKERI